MHRGALALARCEAAGIRIDVPYLERTIKETNEKLADDEATLKQDSIWRRWERRFGSKANFDGRDQLATILFDEMGLTSYKATAHRKWSADKENLEKLDLPFAEAYLEIQQVKNVVARMVGLLREVEGEYLHPFFHLHKVETWRSSSSDPNFQNIPIRLDEQARLIRPAFIPREGNVLSEWDFKGAEVRVGVCNHKDPGMMRYLADPTTDMHRDAAADCYILPKGQVPKEVRQDVKGMFVFASFYGSYYDSIAESLWWVIKLNKLKRKDGTGLYTHLAEHGITELGDLAALRGPGKRRDPPAGTFAAHIKKAYDIQWERRFPIYDKWRRDTYAKYQRDGWLRTVTGFTVHGVYPRNYIINVPIQGPSFHCLLWCLIELQRELRRRGMQSVIVGQIHDSMLIDGPPGELPDLVELMRDIIMRRLPEHWRWLIVPMEVEAAACQPGGNWYTKKEIKL
jgi:DNA polymerase I-like protein with 3'-5' exonuclease and polymerase domains